MRGRSSNIEVIFCVYINYKTNFYYATDGFKEFESSKKELKDIYYRLRDEVADTEHRVKLKKSIDKFMQEVLGEFDQENKDIRELNDEVCKLSVENDFLNTLMNGICIFFVKDL